MNVRLLKRDCTYLTIPPKIKKIIVIITPYFSICILELQVWKMESILR